MQLQGQQRHRVKGQGAGTNGRSEEWGELHSGMELIIGEVRLGARMPAKKT